VVVVVVGFIVVVWWLAVVFTIVELELEPVPGPPGLV
jgi:hypothetical protein